MHVFFNNIFHREQREHFSPSPHTCGGSPNIQKSMRIHSRRAGDSKKALFGLKMMEPQLYQHEESVVDVLEASRGPLGCPSGSGKIVSSRHIHAKLHETYSAQHRAKFTKQLCNCMIGYEGSQHPRDPDHIQIYLSRFFQASNAINTIPTIIDTKIR